MGLMRFGQQCLPVPYRYTGRNASIHLYTLYFVTAPRSARSWKRRLAPG